MDDAPHDAPPKFLTARQRRLVVALADVDERTLRRYERGQPVRDVSRARIERALRAADIPGPDVKADEARVREGFRKLAAKKGLPGSWVDSMVARWRESGAP